MFASGIGADSPNTVPAAETGQPAIQAQGTWGINTNRFYATAGAFDRHLLYDAGVAYGKASIELAVISTMEGILARYVDANNFIRFVQFSGGTELYLQKCVAAAFTTYGNTVFGTVAGDVLALRINPDESLSALVNDVEKLTGTAAPFATTTKWGIVNAEFGGAARTKNFRVVA